MTKNDQASTEALCRASLSPADETPPRDRNTDGPEECSSCDSCNDFFLRMVNCAIYNGTPVAHCLDHPAMNDYLFELYIIRLRHLFGRAYKRKYKYFHRSNRGPQLRYRRIKYRPISHDPFVGELLIRDAIKTGRWKALPKELQDEYHRRTSGER